MHTATLLALVASVSGVSAVTKGFNYGSTLGDGSAKTKDVFQDEFQKAKELAGTTGFTSARIYTMIQGQSGEPIEAIPAALATNTHLLLGIWASAGQESVSKEIAALKKAISSYGEKFADLVEGISVGSEDLYRNSVLGVKNKAGIGADPEVVANYINEVKKAISGTALSKAPVGHVDTWTAWVNGSNQAVIDASDFIGFDAYPYFQDTMSNPISQGKELFQDAYAQTKSAVGSKPIWVTETGWPVSGPKSNLAEPSTKNAKTYWDEVGCDILFDKVPTYWYTLQDALPDTPSPSFGVLGSESTKPLYDLSCKDRSSSTSSDSASESATKSESASASATGDGDKGSPALSEFSSVEASASSASAHATGTGSPVVTGGAGGPTTLTSAAAGGSNGTIPTATSPPVPTFTNAASMIAPFGGFVAAAVAMLAAF